MNDQIADDFIAELALTVRNFEDKRDTAPSFASLLDVSSHMIEALALLRVNMNKAAANPATT